MVMVNSRAFPVASTQAPMRRDGWGLPWKIVIGLQVFVFVAMTLYLVFQVLEIRRLEYVMYQKSNEKRELEQVRKVYSARVQEAERLDLVLGRLRAAGIELMPPEAPTLRVRLQP